MANYYKNIAEVFLINALFDNRWYMENNIVPVVVEKVLAVKMSNLKELAEQVVAFSHYSSVNHK